MPEYTFILVIPYRKKREYLVSVDDTVPLMDAFDQVVQASRGTLSEIPETIPDLGGIDVELHWMFSWGVPGSNAVEMLAETLSLREQGVLPGAEIIVKDDESVGGGEPLPMDYSRRLLRDRQSLQAFIDQNPSHLKIRKATPRTIDMDLLGIRAVVGIEEDGAPIVGDTHGVRILVPPRYPHEAPSVVPLTPIFHPNVCVDGGECSACYTNAYVPDGEDTLAWIVDQYVSMIQYEAYNLREPHRRQNERASLWLEARLQDKTVQFPLRPTVQLKAGHSSG